MGASPRHSSRARLWLVSAAILTASPAPAEEVCASVQAGVAIDAIALADCYQASSQPVRALDVLEQALEDALAAAGDEARAVAVYGRIGSTLTSLGEYRRASERLLLGIELARRAGMPAAAAPLLNELGGGYMATGEPLRGLAAFADADRLARADSPLGVTAGINLLRALAEAGSARQTPSRIESLHVRARALEPSAAQVSALLGLSSLYRMLGPDPAALDDFQTGAGEAAAQALELARALGDDRLASFAYGELGEWHLAHGNRARALEFAREAALTAQAVGAGDSLYRWEWMSGRVLRSMGRQREALAAYRAAIETLAATQATLVMSERVFGRDVLPLYDEYADVMFTHLADLPAADRRAALVEVQQTLEQLRLAEVLNYFENQCAVPEVFDLSDGQSRDAVVIYPVLFEDRTELLVRTPDELFHFTARVSLAELTSEIRALRAAIENADSGRAYLVPAQRIYGWLFEPLMPVIERAAPAALVIVPDGALRTIPLAVLHDGSRFLVERYALATTPGVSLVAGTAHSLDGRALVNGISTPVQGFPALPFVAQELESIAALFPSEVYADEAFRAGTLQREVLEGGYSIVHLATHAQFESDYQRSFLLAYDDLVTMDALEDIIGSRRYTDRPVDLLVLSACQTAAGDERAALGLAGVAVKAGARSALASLWHINDESTARLIGEFYRQLAAGDKSKAEALRGAQLLLMNDERHGHPAHWAPFLMIGDWR